MNIPEYYRQFQNTSVETKTPEKQTKDPQPKIDAKVSEPVPQKKTKEQKPVPAILFQGNGFTINHEKDWTDKTIYTITGPVTDGIQHNIIINVNKDVPFDNLKDYADMQMKTLTQELKGCTLLNRNDIKLFNGLDAVEAYYSWYPVPDIKIYQRQMFILHGTTAYKMTASFTKKTQHTVGPIVERMMLSFNITE